MKKSLLLPFAFLAFLTLTACTGSSYPREDSSLPDNAAPAQTAGTPASAVTLKQNMRKLWSDHVIWTRQYIVAAAAGMPDADAAANRLLKNQDDIGAAIAPYYGNDAAAQLTALLRQHILIAVDLVAAAKAADEAKSKDADKRWTDNAAAIATFLSGANPNWPKQDMLDMLNEHLSLTTEEAVARLHADWEGDIAAFDKIFTQALGMADGLSDGIIKQFPDKFR